MDGTTITPAQSDLEFAGMLSDLADEVERDGDLEFAAYFRDAAQWHRDAALTDG